MTFNSYDFCIVTAAILPIISTIAYLLVRFSDIMYAYSLYLGAAAPIVLGLKLAITPNTILTPYFVPIAIIFLVYIVTVAIFGVFCISRFNKEEKFKKANLKSKLL